MAAKTAGRLGGVGQVDKRQRVFVPNGRWVPAQSAVTVHDRCEDGKKGTSRQD